jgi:MtN3 and saliva related transmembrane protein
MDYIELIGFAAAFLTTAAFLPQVYKTWKTKDVSALSLPMLLMFITGITLWLVYALFIDSPSMIAANGITIGSTILLIYFKTKYGKS